MSDIQRGEQSVPDSLSRDSLGQIVSRYIKQCITEQRLSPGDQLPSEAQIAEKLGISRGSVREAVKSLQSLGIVDVQHGRGLFVRDMNLDSLLEVLTFGAEFDSALLAELVQLRRWLETAAIGEVIQRMDHAQLERIAQCLKRWGDHAGRGSVSSEDDREFHRLLYRNLDNRAFLQLLDIFWVVFNRSTPPEIRTDPQPIQTLDEHRTIFEMVREGNAAAARDAIIRSADHVAERIRREKSDGVVTHEGRSA